MSSNQSNNKSEKSTHSIHQSTLQSTCKSTQMYTETANIDFKCKNCNFQTEHKSSYYRHLKKCDFKLKESITNSGNTSSTS